MPVADGPTHHPCSPAPDQSLGYQLTILKKWPGLVNFILWVRYCHLKHSGRLHENCLRYCLLSGFTGPSVRIGHIIYYIYILNPYKAISESPQFRDAWSNDSFKCQCQVPCIRIVWQSNYYWRNYMHNEVSVPSGTIDSVGPSLQSISCKPLPMVPIWDGGLQYPLVIPTA